MISFIILGTNSVNNANVLLNNKKLLLRRNPYNFVHMIRIYSYTYASHTHIRFVPWAVAIYCRKRTVKADLSSMVMASRKLILRRK